MQAMSCSKRYLLTGFPPQERVIDLNGLYPDHDHIQMRGASRPMCGFGPVLVWPHSNLARAGTKTRIMERMGAFSASCGGRGVLDKRQPFVGTTYIYTGDLGGRPAAYAPVRPDVIVVEYRHVKYQRLFLVYAAGVPEVARKLAVEPLLFVGVAYEVPYVDIAYVDGPETLHGMEHPLEGDVVLVEAVRDEHPGNPARHVPGPPQQGAASYPSLVAETSHARTNLVERSMTATIHRSLPRMSCRFSSQPHLSPTHEGLSVSACRSTMPE